MGIGDRGMSAEEARPAREGMLDPQMSLAMPGVSIPGPITTLLKRDGHEEAFDKAKIAQAILLAARAADASDPDRAASLASGVAIYLAKELDGQPPTADHVAAAVEKVLIEMGHARVALAYARFRERRQRTRRLRRRDPQAVLDSLTDASRARAIGAEAAFFVRTSTENVAEWDRERIVQALVRETGLDTETAADIALEVEEQIGRAGVHTLTAPLVRELVNAKLIEHGLEAHWRRHARLGVPLYDAERIIRGLDAEAAPVDPEATGRTLAESVKRAFALDQVFSEETAAAHVLGDCFIHDLASADRLHSLTPSLAAIARFGLGVPGARTFAEPPGRADTLLAQMVNASVALQAHCAGVVRWDALNILFAPFLEGLDEQALRQIAQMLVYEYAYRAALGGDPRLHAEIGLCWETPSWLADAEAIGPDGAGTGRVYRDYLHVAQRFAWMLIDVLREGGVSGVTFPAPTPAVRLSPAFFRAAGHDAFLQHVSEAAAAGRNIHFVLDRDAWLIEGLEPWEMRGATVQRVTLNLPRMAYRARDEDHLFRELERVLETAVRAHGEKRDFIESLLALDEVGPLGLLASRRGGRPALDMHRARYLVGLTGLNECVQAFTGAQIHADEGARALALRLTERAAALCAEWGESLDLQLAPALTSDATVNRRFAALDLDSYAGAAAVVRTDPSTHDVFYSPGARLNPEAGLSPVERARIEGLFHAAAPTDACTEIAISDTATSARAIGDFLSKTHHHTGCRRVVVSG